VDRWGNGSDQSLEPCLKQDILLHEKVMGMNEQKTNDIKLQEERVNQNKKTRREQDSNQ
jgi:hypothetical protein